MSLKMQKTLAYIISFLKEHPWSAPGANVLLVSLCWQDTSDISFETDLKDSNAAKIATVSPWQSRLFYMAPYIYSI